MTNQEIMKLLAMSAIDAIDWLRKNLNEKYRHHLPSRQKIKKLKDKYGDEMYDESILDIHADNLLGNLAFLLRFVATESECNERIWYKNIEPVYNTEGAREDVKRKGEKKERLKLVWLCAEATATDWIVISLLALNSIGPFKAIDEKSKITETEKGD